MKILCQLELFPEADVKNDRMEAITEINEPRES
jgi:hypothetical protein